MGRGGEGLLNESLLGWLCCLKIPLKENTFSNHNREEQKTVQFKVARTTPTAILKWYMYLLSQAQIGLIYQLISKFLASIPAQGIFLREHQYFTNIIQIGKWFEPRSLSRLCGLIIRARVVLRRTVVGRVATFQK